MAPVRPTYALRAHLGMCRASCAGGLAPAVLGVMVVLGALLGRRGARTCCTLPEETASAALMVGTAICVGGRQPGCCQCAVAAWGRQCV